MHKTSVRPLAPWWLQRVIFSGKASQKAPECVVFGAEDTWDVFPEDDALVFTASNSNMVNCICYLHKFKGEVPALVGQRFAQAGHAECLAGGAATEHIGRRDFLGQQQRIGTAAGAEVRRQFEVVTGDPFRIQLATSGRQSRSS